MGYIIIAKKSGNYIHIDAFELDSLKWRGSVNPKEGEELLDFRNAIFKRGARRIFDKFIKKYELGHRPYPTIID